MQSVVPKEHLFQNLQTLDVKNAQKAHIRTL